MKKRLRKKLRLGEFAEYGFPIRVTFAEDLTENGRDRLIDSIVDLCSARGLSLGGGGTHEFEGFVFRHRKSCTEGDLEYVREALSYLHGVKSVEVGPLEDAWH